MHSPDASSLSFLFLSLRRKRFIHTYFTQLDAEYEHLCDDAYKQRVHDEVDALRKAGAVR